MINKNEDILPSDIGMYTNLHAHSRYSALDGFSDIEDYVIRAKAMGMHGVLFSDHGNMSCAYELEKICGKHGIKPIYANELYFTPNDPLKKEKIDGFKPSYHILLIAYNQEGYSNLMKLSSDAWTKYRYYKPRVSWEQLEAHKEGIICLSACIGGYSQQMLLENKTEEAEDAIKRFKSIYGKNYYLEMQWTGIEEQNLVNSFFREMSEKLDVPLVITCDSHYSYSSESELHRALVTINTGGIFKKRAEIKIGELTDDKDTDESSMFYTPGEYYLKPYHVLEKYFNRPQDKIAFENTNKIADMCNVILPKGLKIFPQIISDPDSFIRSKCIQFLDEYCKYMDEEKRKVYFDRFEEEYWIIYRMGYCDYFVVVSDFLNWAQNNNILTGPGRGSGASSIIAFSLGITWIDPIKYNLLFSRFLSSARAKMPLIEFEGFPIEENL